MILIAAVREGNRAYFIDVKGKKKDLGYFQSTDNFSCGWACVNLGGDRIQNPPGVIGGNFRFIDVNGAFLPFRFNSNTYFSCQRAIIERNFDHIIIDTEGKVLAEGFSKIYPYKDNLAAASKNNSLGFLNTEGNWEFLLKPEDILHSYSDGIAKIERNSKSGFINQTGQWLIEPSSLEIFDFHERLAVFCENEKYGVINDEGDKMVNAIYDDLGHYSDGLCAFRKNSKWGYLDRSGSEVVPNIYDGVRPFSEGKAAILLNGEVGFINLKGHEIVAPQFENGFEFKNDYAIIQVDGKLGYIDQKGEIQLETKFDRANHFVSPDEDNSYYRPS